MPQRKVEVVADVLTRVVRALDIEKELLQHTAGPVWARTVGERLAEHTRAVQLRGGVLRVEARSAVWMNEVSLLRERIVEQLNIELRGPVVREVRFRLGGGFAPLQGAPPSKQVCATDDEIDRAAEALGGTRDEGARLAARAYALSRKAAQ